MANYIKKIASCCPLTGGGASSLAELSDVDINNPQDGLMLRYNATSSKWETLSYPIDAETYQEHYEDETYEFWDTIIPNIKCVKYNTTTYDGDIYMDNGQKLPIGINDIPTTILIHYIDTGCPPVILCYDPEYYAISPAVYNVESDPETGDYRLFISLLSTTP